MAYATLTITPLTYPAGSTLTRTLQEIRGTIVVNAGNYPENGGSPPDGGEGFDFQWGLIEAIKSIAEAGVTTIAPVYVDFRAVGSPVSGYTYQWDNVKGNLHVVNSSGVEISAGQAVPAAVLADTISFTAYFVKN